MKTMTSGCLYCQHLHIEVYIWEKTLLPGSLWVQRVTLRGIHTQYTTQGRKLGKKQKQHRRCKCKHDNSTTKSAQTNVHNTNTTTTTSKSLYLNLHLPAGIHVWILEPTPHLSFTHTQNTQSYTHAPTHTLTQTMVSSGRVTCPPLVNPRGEPRRRERETGRQAEGEREKERASANTEVELRRLQLRQHSAETKTDRGADRERDG